MFSVTLFFFMSPHLFHVSFVVKIVHFGSFVVVCDVNRFTYVLYVIRIRFRMSSS